jgi:hypothetical protein
MTTTTFDTEWKTEADRVQWLQAHDERHRVLVAEDAWRGVICSTTEGWI